MLALSTKHRNDAATAMLPHGPQFSKRFVAFHRRLVPQTKRSRIILPPATQTNGAFSWLSIVLWLSCWGAVLVTQEFIQCAARSFRRDSSVTLTAPCVVRVTELSHPWRGCPTDPPGTKNQAIDKEILKEGSGDAVIAQYDPEGI